MNQRIKELAEQAEKYADDNFKGEPTYSEAYDSKFAELIVRECARKCDTFSSFTKDKYPEAYETATNIRYNILDHFGVEE